MLLKEQKLVIDGRGLLIAAHDGARALLIQPVDGHDISELPALLSSTEAHTHVPFAHVALPIQRWNDELTPWPAPPVFGKTPFGAGAAATLELITQRVVPAVCSALCLDTDLPVVLGGYSLAGLFALWAAYQTRFAAVAAASPSVWYPQWLDYAATHTPLTRVVYLSLGDRESRSRTPIMATVDSCMQRQRELFQAQGVTMNYETTAGNHFQDNGIRMARGFVYALNNLQQLPQHQNRIF